MKCPGCGRESSESAASCSHCGGLLPPDSDPLESPTANFPGFGRSLAPGDLFAGRYRIVEDLGEGGMGRVYKVFDEEMKETLALKLLLPEIADDSATIARFRNELRLARMISHPNVCRVHDIDRDDGTHYLTMEFVEGRSLRTVLDEHKELAPEAAVSLAGQIAAGLAAAHGRGVVHRDLKPQNVMVDAAGHARIMDFGLALSSGAEGEDRRGPIIGTPEYMSPEQAEGREADGRSDIYALGVMLYEMVTGRRPFAGRSTAEVLHKQRTERPEEPGKLRPLLPEGLDRVILNCLEKSKENRYRTAADLGRALAAVGPSVETSAGGTAQPKARRLRRPALAAFVLLAAAAAGIFLWRWQAPRPQAVPSGDALRVAVAAFTNRTGETGYDYLQEAVPNLLITSLEQAEGIRVTAWERLADLRRRLGKPDRREIDLDLGFELCRLDGVDVLIHGGYAKQGETFITETKAYDVRTKSVIRSVRAQGDGVGSLLDRQIDEISADFVRALTTAESVGQATVTPINEMTTGVMAAYDAFLKGRQAFENARLDDARNQLESAVRLDPAFPLAWLYLARVHEATGDIPALRATVQDYTPHQAVLAGREGLYVEALAARLIDRDPEKHIRTLELLLARYEDKRARVDLGEAHEGRGFPSRAEADYQRALEVDPRFGPALVRLARLLLERREFDRALEYLGRYAESCPGEPAPLDALGGAYFAAGRFDRAIAACEEASRLRPDFGSDLKVGYCQAVREDYAEATSSTDRFIAAAPPGRDRARGYLVRGFYLQVQGRLAQAFKEWDAAEALLRSLGDDRGLEAVEDCRLWTYYDWERDERFIEAARAAVERRRTKGLDEAPVLEAMMEYYEGLHDARAGKAEAARARLAAVRSRLSETKDPRPSGRLRQAARHLAFELLLAAGRTREAIAELEKADWPAVDLSSGAGFIAPNLPFLEDLSARTLIAKKETDKAIAEYRRLLNPMNTGRRLVHPLARFRLARLLERAGRRREALEQYRRAAEIWADADGDVSEAAEAKARLEALKTP